MIYCYILFKGLDWGLQKKGVFVPRIARLDTKAHYFHTMVQGIEKSFIFDNPSSMKKYLDLIYIKSQLCNVSILSYCIMNNHAHILIYTKNIENMIKFFRCVNTSYAKYFNYENNRVGYVFRNRYKSEEILTLKQLYNTINYIHSNPIKANICKYANEYEFSSYNEFFGNSNILNKNILYHFLNERDFEKFFKIIDNKEPS